jgi:hypothetical protein
MFRLGHLSRVISLLCAMHEICSNPFGDCKQGRNLASAGHIGVVGGAESSYSLYFQMFVVLIFTSTLISRLIKKIKL